MTPLEKRAEELAQIIREFDGDMKVEFIAKYPEIWNDCYDVMEQSRYHRVMINCFKAGFMSALKYQPEVKNLISALEYYQHAISHEGMALDITKASEALKAWGEFVAGSGDV